MNKQELKSSVEQACVELFKHLNPPKFKKGDKVRLRIYWKVEIVCFKEINFFDSFNSYKNGNCPHNYANLDNIYYVQDGSEVYEKGEKIMELIKLKKL